MSERFGITFNNLFTLANMPIQRFGAILLSQGTFDAYLDTLTHAHRAENLDGVMCRNLLSVDYRGYVYDCDFNQMLDLPFARDGARARASLRPARRRHRRQPDPRRRPLLRLHRRTGLELRRRAEGSRGVTEAAARASRISIIIPVLNEAANVVAALDALAPLRARGAEIIVVDGGSSDDTAALAKPLADFVIASARGRAVQMNAGAALARGDVLLFLHADTRLPDDADRLSVRRTRAGRTARGAASM